MRRLCRKIRSIDIDEHAKQTRSGSQSRREFLLHRAPPGVLQFGSREAKRREGREQGEGPREGGGGRENSRSIRRCGPFISDIKRQLPKLWRFFRRIPEESTLSCSPMGGRASSLSAVTRVGTSLAKKDGEQVGRTNETLPHPPYVRVVLSVCAASKPLASVSVLAFQEENGALVCSPMRERRVQVARVARLRCNPEKIITCG